MEVNAQKTIKIPDKLPDSSCVGSNPLWS